MYILFLNSENTEFQEGITLHWFLMIYITDPPIKIIVWQSIYSFFFADSALGKSAGVLDRIWK